MVVRITQAAAVIRPSMGPAGPGPRAPARPLLLLLRAAMITAAWRGRAGGCGGDNKTHFWSAAPVRIHAPRRE